MPVNLLNFGNGSSRTCGCSDASDANSCLHSQYIKGGSYKCPLIWHTYGTQNIYVADVENFTLSISHYLNTYALQLFRNRFQMNGWLAVDLDAQPSKAELQHRLCKRASDRQAALAAARAEAKVRSRTSASAGNWQN